MKLSIKTKKYVITALTALFLFSTMFTSALAVSENKDYTKNENVYAKLSADGTLGDIYVVNVFDIKNPSTIKDYGSYSKVDNLTDLEPLDLNNGEVEFQGEKGRFYFQGVSNNMSLPWNISLKYYLDDEEITPEDLAGKTGDLEIKLNITENNASNSIFYDNYLMQISLTLDSDKCTNITAESATIAEAGTNQNITFTLMPGSNGDFSIKSKVTEFEMSGLSIAAVPYAMSMDLEDLGTDEMTSELTTLSDAIQLLNDGTQLLNDGIGELSKGGISLKDGASQISSGLTELNNSSSAITNASKQIGDALQFISNQLSNNDLSGLDGLNELVPALGELASALEEIQVGLNALREGFITAYGALNSTIASSANQLTNEEMLALQTAMNNASGDEIASSMYQKLLKSYSDVKTIEGTFNAVKPAFEGVIAALNPTPAAGFEETSIVYGLSKVAEGLTEMHNQLSSSLEGNDIAQSLEMLEVGLSELSTNYSGFHDGLKSYTAGVSALAEGSKDLSSGIDEYVSGVNQTESGTVELAGGMQELANGTKDIPSTIENSMDELMEKYSGGDFDAVSFVDERNTEVETVQFIISTEAITIPAEADIETEEVKESFWDRLLNLFKRK